MGQLSAAWTKTAKDKEKLNNSDGGFTSCSERARSRIEQNRIE